MRFFSNSSIPSSYVKWVKVGDTHELWVKNQIVLISEIPPTTHYKILTPKHKVLYHGTDLTRAKQVQDLFRARESRIETFQGLPDFQFDLDREKKKPPHITARDDDSIRCLVQITITGKYGFKIVTDGEILADTIVEIGSLPKSGTMLTVIALLAPKKSLVIDYLGLKTSRHQSLFVWDGELMKTYDRSKS